MTIFVGKTIEEAKKQAAAKLAPTATEKLVIKVLQQPRHGFLGIGRRQAKIEATIQKAVGKQSQPKPAKAKTTKPSQQPTVTKDDQLDPAEIKRRHQANIKRSQVAGQQLLKYLTTVFKELGIDVTPEITDTQAHELKVDLKTAQSGRVIGRHGRRINAMEQLSNTFMDYHGAAKVRVVLDTANYRERRRKTVSQLAERAVTEVVASGKAVFMNPMPAVERKQIHQELENNPHVKTYSHGREPYRSIVIAPKN